MKMLPLWLTCSACSTSFLLNGVQIEQGSLLTSSGGPGLVGTKDQTKTLGKAFRSLLDPHLARSLVKLSLTLKQATVAGQTVI